MAAVATSTDETLSAAESRLQDALRAGDVTALAALLHSDVVFVGPDGAEVGKEADLEAHRSGALRLREVIEINRSVTDLGDVGLTRVRLHLRGEAWGSRLDAVMAYTRTWVREEGAWRVLQAQGVVVQ